MEERLNTKKLWSATGAGRDFTRFEKRRRERNRKRGKKINTLARCCPSCSVSIGSALSGLRRRHSAALTFGSIHFSLSLSLPPPSFDVVLTCSLFFTFFFLRDPLFDVDENDGLIRMATHPLSTTDPPILSLLYSFLPEEYFWTRL
jgi:hypothetical protein